MVSHHQDMDTSTDGVGVATFPESMEIDDPDSDSDSDDSDPVLDSRDSLAKKSSNLLKRASSTLGLKTFFQQTASTISSLEKS
jgi:hypothetical protein